MGNQRRHIIWPTQFPSSSATYAHYKKLTHACTYSTCVQTHPQLHLNNQTQPNNITNTQTSPFPLLNNRYIPNEHWHLPHNPSKVHNSIMALPVPLHHKTMRMPCHTQTCHLSYHHHLPGENHTLHHPKLELAVHRIYIMTILDPNPATLWKGKTKIRTFGERIKRNQLVCNTNHPHIVHPRRHRHEQHHQRHQTILHTFNVHTCM